jgi:isoleucyl-tRNA synthetase
MPFAQYHAPFENEERFRARYPANFVCEALDQTRGWFYSLLAESVLLFDRSPYENVVCLGLILDAEGQKMSKSKGNIVVPWEVIDRFGADAVRWYFFTSKQPWDGYRFNIETIGDSVRLFLRQLWNTYAFLTTYRPERPGERTDLDRWVLSRLSATVAEVTERLDAFDATTAGRAIADFVDDLSNWYVRRSRRRFWEGDSEAFAVLEQALVTVAQLLAPFTPFVADEIYDNLDGTLASVHLTDWPEPGERDVALEEDMAVAREAVRLGLSARSAAKLKLRQPLHEAVVVAAGREREAIERLADVVRDELNVKELRFVEAADELGSYELKPNYRTLGPRFGKWMPQVAAAVAALVPEHVAAALRAGRPVGIAIDGHDHQLGPDDVQLVMRPLEGYQLEREGSHAVALELALDDELRREGLAREVVHAVQNARKAAGLAVEDRIRLVLAGDDELVGAARAHEGYVAREVLAVEVAYDGGQDGAAASIEGRELRIGVARA